MTFGNHDQETVRHYLLGRATDDEQQKVEERLLTDDDFFDELEITKDELVEDYLAKQLTQQEREWFEQNFLASPEGKKRQAFSSALNRYVLNHEQLKKTPGWGERLGAFWNNQPALLRVAAALAVVVIVAGIVWVSRTPAPRSFATLTLPNTTITRSSGAEVPRIKLTDDALRIKLMFPSPAAPGARYRVELLNDKGETKTPAVEGQDPQSVSVVIPAAQLNPGQYAITLSIINSDGSVQRISGGYHFIVE